MTHIYVTCVIQTKATRTHERGDAMQTTSPSASYNSGALANGRSASNGWTRDYHESVCAKTAGVMELVAAGC